jgi:hypothetical protein
MVHVAVYRIRGVTCQDMTIIVVGIMLRNQRVLYSILDTKNETCRFQENIIVLLSSLSCSFSFALVCVIYYL